MLAELLGGPKKKKPHRKTKYEREQEAKQAAAEQAAADAAPATDAAPIAVVEDSRALNRASQREAPPQLIATHT